MPNQSKPEIHNLMVVSSEHLSRTGITEMELLIKNPTRSAGRGVFVDQFEYGYHITLDDDDDPSAKWINDSVRDIVVFARQYGCTHVRIDADGPVTKGIPVYKS